jgi:hypothetical protein
MAQAKGAEDNSAAPPIPFAVILLKFLRVMVFIVYGFSEKSKINNNSSIPIFTIVLTR